MNLLPMVFAFLFIFATISITFLKEMKSFFLFESSIEAHHRIERVLSNTIATRAYQKIKTELKPATPSFQPKKETKPKTFYSKRTSFPPFINSKLNLTPLLDKSQDAKQHPFYEPLAKLLRELYQKPLFARLKREKIEYQLLNALFKKAKEKEVIEDLTDLIPDDPLLSSIYYKLLKGTNQVKDQKGYPPLADYLILEEEDAPIVYFSFASPPLLEALFGHTIKEAILNKEKEKWQSENPSIYLTKEELQALLAEHPSQMMHFSLIEPFLDFSKQFFPREEIGGKDPATGMTLRKPL